MGQEKARKEKGKGIKKFFDVLLWIIGFFVIAFSALNIIDRSTSYKVPLFGYHDAVVVTNSMSEVYPGNESYLPTDSTRIKKNDLVIIHEYSSYEDVELYDVVAYINESGLLITHRVINKYQTEYGNFIVTKGDANSSEDIPFEYSALRGEVVKVIPSIGNVIMFIQSYYFLLAVFGIAFFIFLGIYISQKVEEKERKKNIEKKPAKKVLVSDKGNEQTKVKSVSNKPKTTKESVKAHEKK